MSREHGHHSDHFPVPGDQTAVVRVRHSGSDHRNQQIEGFTWVPHGGAGGGQQHSLFLTPLAVT